MTALLADTPGEDDPRALGLRRQIGGPERDVGHLDRARPTLSELLADLRLAFTVGWERVMRRNIELNRGLIQVTTASCRICTRPRQSKRWPFYDLPAEGYKHPCHVGPPPR